MAPISACLGMMMVIVYLLKVRVLPMWLRTDQDSVLCSYFKEEEILIDATDVVKLVLQPFHVNILGAISPVDD